MRKKILGIVERVKNKKALGIIYNIPKSDASVLQNKLLDERKVISVKGRDAYTSPMLLFRLGYLLKIKKLEVHQLAALLDGKIVMVTEADIIKSSYSRVFEDFSKYKIPLLLLMNSDSTIKDLRKFGSYQRVLTIEQDYSSL